MMGFSPYTIWSFFIKGTAGFVVGYASKGLWPENIVPKQALLRSIVGMLLAATCTLAGYIIAWWQVSGSIVVAIGNIPSSLISSTVGFVVASIIAPKLRQVLKNNRLI